MAVNEQALSGFFAQWKAQELQKAALAGMDDDTLIAARIATDDLAAAAAAEYDRRRQQTILNPSAIINYPGS